MNKDAHWLVHDHRRYDLALEDCEFAAEAGDWKSAVQLFNAFVKELELHMRMEDEVLYPLIKTETGDPRGDLVLLGHEHDDLVRLLSDLAYIIKTRDFDHFEKSLKPLHRAMVQHNDHEEIVFLSLPSEALLLRRDEITSRLNTLHS